IEPDVTFRDRVEHQQGVIQNTAHDFHPTIILTAFIKNRLNLRLHGGNAYPTEISKFDRIIRVASRECRADIRHPGDWISGARCPDTLGAKTGSVLSLEPFTAAKESHLTWGVNRPSSPSLA